MPADIVRRNLRLPGYKVFRHQFEEEASTVTLWVRKVGSAPAFICSGCGVGKHRIHSARERRGRALPGGAGGGGRGGGGRGGSGWWSTCTGCTAGGAAFARSGSASSRASIPIRRGSARPWPGTVR